MRRMTTLLVLAALTSPARGQGTTNPKPDPGSPGVNAEIEALEEQLRVATLDSDVPRLDELWADDYLRVNSRGERASKAEAIDDFRSGALSYEVLDFDEVEIRVQGSTLAVVSCRATVRGEVEESRVAGRFRQTRVWFKQDDRWRVVSFHASRIEGR